MTVDAPDSGPLRLETRLIASKDELKRFSCGNNGIDKWARADAHRLTAKGRVRVHVARHAGGVTPVGFYALSFAAEAPRKLLTSEDKDAWKDTAPLVYLNYLAVANGHQSQGIGSNLLIESLKRAYQVHQLVPLYGVGLRALNERTANLYARYGFARAPDEDDKTHPLMILPIWTLDDLFGARA